MNQENIMLDVIIENVTTLKILKGTPLSEVYEKVKSSFNLPILGAIVNNELSELSKKIMFNCTIKFIDITDKNGFRIYQRTASFIMICAIKEILGRKTKVVISNSIMKNFYCEIQEDNFEVTDDFLQQVENKMSEIINNNTPIEKFSLPIEEGISIAMEMGLYDKVNHFKYRRTSSVTFHKIGWFYNYFYGPIASNTNVIEVFKLIKEGSGFILQFPSKDGDNTIPDKLTLTKITNIFAESKNWCKILNVETVSSLNDIITDLKLGEFIRTNEALHEKKIANIADQITDNHKKVVLISGPSSSGKTTFAHRLSIQLRVNGLIPHVVSLDNYYVNTTHTPIDEFGNKDYEALEAIDVALINENLSDLINGKKVEIPTFNFKTGRREYRQNFIELQDGHVLILEGIHGLNPKVSCAINNSQKFKIFISALTQLNLDDHNRIATTDTRLIRRIVRDMQFRGFDPINTLSVWDSVGRGEAKHVFPFQEEADVIFNSSLVYELCVLKQFAEPMLFKVDRSVPEYTEAKRLVKFLDSFIGIPSEDVPINSILREFIGGSCFK